MGELIIFNVQIAECVIAAVGLETGSGRARLFNYWARPVIFCSITGHGRGLIFLARAGF